MFLIVWFVSNSLPNFVWMASDWLIGSSNWILLMVIGNCFIQITPSNGVMSLLFGIKIGNFVVFPLYSISTQVYLTNLISFFRSRKKFPTTYAIVLFFFVFFLPVNTIFTKFCTVILHPKGPQRAQRHQNRMVGM